MKSIYKKKYVWSFLGQVQGKPTRKNMLAELKKVRGKHFIHITEKWNDVKQINTQDYKKILAESIFVPCPSGWGGAKGLKDCFRLYESLEAGSIPIVEKDDFAYFDKFFPGHPFLQIPSDWSGIGNDLESLLSEPQKLQEYNNQLIEWWSNYKNNLKLKITQSLQMKHKPNKLAILIQSCDHYDFLWDGWKNYFLKNWDFSIPAEIYFCTEDKDFTCDGITNIKTGKCETQNTKGASTFSNRMKNAVNQINADYILYLQEDMWLHKPINSKLFNDAFQYCVDQDLNVLNFGYKLNPNRKLNINGETFSIDDFKQYIDNYIGDKQVYNRLCSADHLKTYNPFSVTHHSCFFKKKFLQKYLCIEGETPIENEVKSSERIYRDYISQNAKIQGIDYKWYEHVCQGGKLNEVGRSMTLTETCFTSIDRNMSIQNKWSIILHQLKSGCNVFAVTSNLYCVNKKQTIQQYIDADTDIALCEHNYNAWGCNIESSISSAYIYIKHSPRTIALIEALHFQLSNVQEDDRFFSYKEQYADHALQKIIESQGGGLKVKKIKNDQFAVSEEIYGKNIEHYKSNPPAYINFDRNVYTEELKKVYFDASPNTQ